MLCAKNGAMRYSEGLQNAALGVLVACALVMTGFVVHREIISTQRRAVPPVVDNTIDATTAHQLVTKGHRIGPDDARLTIVQFVDLECPFCAMADGVLDSVLHTFEQPIAVLVRHFPLQTIHPHAYTAALAAECAAAEGKFSTFIHTVYAAQDSLGILDWSTLARRAGIQNAQEFKDCVNKGMFADRIRDDLVAGTSAGIHGTPTYVIGNTLYLGDPAHPRFRELIQQFFANAKGK